MGNIFDTVVFWAGVAITLLTGGPVLIQLLRGHPRGLFVLFFAEMWERFSYYGMRGLLVYYLTKHFLFDDAFAGNQYGSYTSLVYLLPLLGGLLADKYLGTRKAIVFGAILLVAGHGLMAVEGGPAKQTLDYTSPAGVHARYDVKVPDGKAGVVPLVMIDGKGYEFSSVGDTGLTIKNLPADASVPATLAKGSYKFEAKRDSFYVDVFYLALALIIMGVGYLKANISSIVGQLYKQGDPRRDPGFTLYYYGVNLGAFWAAILCGYLGQNVGWSWGFGAAGIGMALGLVVFILGKKALEGHGEPPNPELLKRPLIGPVSREWLIYLLGIVGVGGVWVLVQHNDIVGWMLGICSSLVVLYILFLCFTKFSKQERERIFLAMFLVVGAVVFWTLFEQAGSSLSLFAERNTNLTLIAEPMTWHFGGKDILFATVEQIKAANIDVSKVWWVDMGFTSSQTQTFNAGFILLFAPLFAWLWTVLGKRGKDPNPVTKFGLALLQVGLGFLLLVGGAMFADSGFRLPLLFLALAYLLHTTGELCMSPVGLSQITKLSPASIVSTMMAVWFLASSAAQFVGGKIAALAGTETAGGEVLDPHAALESSLKVFNMIGWAGIGAGVLFLILAPFLKHWAHGANDPQANPSHLTDRGQEL